MNLLRRALPLALSFSLAAAGCDTAPRSEVEFDTVQTRASVTDRAEALAADPDFVSLAYLSTQIVGDILTYERSLSDEDLDAMVQTITHPAYADTTDAASLLTNLGGDTNDLLEIQSLTATLIDRHGMRDATPEQIELVFETAMAQGDMVSELEAWIEEMLDTSVDPETEECLEQCELNYQMAVGGATVGMVIGLVVAASRGVLAGSILALGVLGATGKTLAWIWSLREQCIEECYGIEDDSCGWDADCPADDYCWTGVLGIGKNECRPEKAEGKTCARDGQCQSGCCKYHLPSNPLSQVCRPSSKCN